MLQGAEALRVVLVPRGRCGPRKSANEQHRQQGYTVASVNGLEAKFGPALTAHESSQQAQPFFSARLDSITDLWTVRFDLRASGTRPLQGRKVTKGP